MSVTEHNCCPWWQNLKPGGKILANPGDGWHEVEVIFVKNQQHPCPSDHPIIPNATAKSAIAFSDTARYFIGSGVVYAKISGKYNTQWVFNADAIKPLE